MMLLLVSGSRLSAQPLLPALRNKCVKVRFAVQRIRLSLFGLVEVEGHDFTSPSPFEKRISTDVQIFHRLFGCHDFLLRRIHYHCSPLLGKLHNVLLALYDLTDNGNKAYNTDVPYLTDNTGGDARAM